MKQVWNKRISDNDLISAYKINPNIWIVGKIVGLCGQSVYERLVKLGVIHRKNLWTKNDEKILLNEYEKYRSIGRLSELASKLKRTKQFICRKAKCLGLTDLTTSGECMKELHDKLSKSAKERIKQYGHPKGFKGHHHTQSARDKISYNSKMTWSNPNHWLNSEEHKQQLSDRMSIEQSKGILNNNYSRVHSGTVVIGGKTNFYRSSWEVNIAAYYEFLKNKKEIKEWEYEPTVFWFEKIKRGVRSYKPDFRITKNDDTQYYVEVKGWMDDKSKTKLKRMKIYYPEIKLELLCKDRYKEISKYSSIIPDWDALENGNKIKFKKCKIEGCENKSFCKNMCRKHYYKIYRK